MCSRGNSRPRLIVWMDPQSGASNLADLDSVYARTTSITGTPLHDGYHFGQSIVNDYGRPYAAGFNAIAGFTAHAEAGPLFVSVQEEYQRAPAVSSEPLSVLEATAGADSTLPLRNGVGGINRMRLVQGAVGLTFNGIQLSFGQQSLWLGPGHAGPFLFSNNAEPMTMLRIDSVSPYEVPLLSRVPRSGLVGVFSGKAFGSELGVFSATAKWPKSAVPTLSAWHKIQLSSHGEPRVWHGLHGAIRGHR